MTVRNRTIATTLRIKELIKLALVEVPLIEAKLVNPI